MRILAMVVVLVLAAGSQASAVLIENGDFSDGLNRWSVSGSPAAVTTPGSVAFMGMDLSCWGSKLEDNFLLIGSSGYLGTSIELSGTLPPYALSFDIAVAWKNAKENYPNPWDRNGYFAVSFTAITDTGLSVNVRPSRLEYNWGTGDPETSGVFVDSYHGQILDINPCPDCNFVSGLLGIAVYNTNGDLYQIVGFDNFNFSPVSPVPEPTTLLLLGMGLIGLAGYGRKKEK
jgi:hypothetical protein